MDRAGFFFLIRQLGQWLDKHISEICSFRPLKAIPELRHMSRAGRVDCRGAVQVIDEENGQASQAMKPHHIVAQQQALCWHYCSQVAFELQKAQFKSLTISSDGWRGKGEAMELYFAFSPELNVGGYLPFQVPRHTHAWQTCTMSHSNTTGETECRLRQSNVVISFVPKPWLSVGHWGSSHG